MIFFFVRYCVAYVNWSRSFVLKNCWHVFKMSSQAWDLQVGYGFELVICVCLASIALRPHQRSSFMWSQCDRCCLRFMPVLMDRTSGPRARQCASAAPPGNLPCGAVLAHWPLLDSNRMGAHTAMCAGGVLVLLSILLLFITTYISLGGCRILYASGCLCVFLGSLFVVPSSNRAVISGGLRVERPPWSQHQTCATQRLRRQTTAFKATASERYRCLTSCRIIPRQLWPHQRAKNTRSVCTSAASCAVPSVFVT